MKTDLDNLKREIVSPEGSLGLLALGYRGVAIWRAAKKNQTEAQPHPSKDG
jgi:hypothetical protein